MKILDIFKAKKGFIFVHKFHHLYGSVVYSTEDSPYTLEEFDEVPKEDLEKIIEHWRSNNADNTTRE